MTILLTDKLVDDLRAYVDANVGTYITAVNTAFNDAITLGSVDSVRVDDPETGVRVQIQNAVVNIVATVGTIGHWNQSVAHAGQDVVFWITVREQDKEALRRKLYRYLLALWNCLVAGHYSADFDWAMGIEVDPQFDYSETFTSNNVLHADARLVIRFATMEAA